jgi:hypothetical protein
LTVKTFLRLTGLVVLALLLIGAVFVYRNTRDRFPGYRVDVKTPDHPPAPLRVGFAALKITPALPDTWVDKNGDARFDEADGDTYADRNGNGRFDGVWMAGFQNRRPAQGIHDDLWARAVVIDDGTTRLALVALDLIGFGNDRVIRVRQRVPSSAGVTYLTVSSTHQHEGPDMLGLWGPGDYRSGVDAEYAAFVEKQAANAVVAAVANLRPARLKFAMDATGAAPLVADTRPPKVFDNAVKVMQVLDARRDSTLGTLVVWGNHPEVLWNKNLQLTSDFAHYLRSSLEKSLGGTAVFVNGAVGGLMTTDPDTPVAEPGTGRMLKEPTFQKAAAVGNTVATLALNALKTSTDTLSRGTLRLRARTIELPLDNALYKIGVYTGLLGVGYTRWGHFRSEVAAWCLGPATFVAVPGELYPELFYGGVEAPKGQDFPIKKPTDPPLAPLAGKYPFLLGLTGDELGYILPKSQWDAEAPFTYDYQERPYGEINSVGPETAGIVVETLRAMLTDLKREK